MIYIIECTCIMKQYSHYMCNTYICTKGVIEKKMIKGYKHCAGDGGMLEGLYESLPSFQQFKKQTKKI